MLAGNEGFSVTKQERERGARRERVERETEKSCGLLFARESEPVSRYDTVELLPEERYDFNDFSP